MAELSVPFARATDFTVRAGPVADGVVVVFVSGEVDLATAAELHAAFLPSIADPAVRLVVCDLSMVAFFACSGLTVLLDVQTALADRGARIRVVARHPAVVRPITATGLAEALPVRRDLAAALAD